jgi:serine O-acetyltransferase
MKSLNPRSIEHPKRGAEHLYYLSHGLYRKKLYFLARVLKLINQFLFHVNIPPEVTIGRRLELAHGGFGVIMHHDTVIGDDAIIFQNVTIGNGGARIGDRVYIGASAVIIGAVNIGNDATIGANAVVNFDIPHGGTAVGPKARIVASREQSPESTDL